MIAPLKKLERKLVEIHPKLVFLYFLSVVRNYYETTKLVKPEKYVTAANIDRKIKKLCVDDRKKIICGYLQSDIARVKVMLSATTVWRRIQEYGLNAKNSTEKSDIYLSNKD